MEIKDLHIDDLIEVLRSAVNRFAETRREYRTPQQAEHLVKLAKLIRDMEAERYWVFERKMRAEYNAVMSEYAKKDNADIRAKLAQYIQWLLDKMPEN